MENELKSGWITKEGGRHKTWKKRFMTFDGNLLTYYEKEVLPLDSSNNAEKISSRYY
mgnify:CR=1 FL=1